MGPRSHPPHALVPLPTNSTDHSKQAGCMIVEYLQLTTFSIYASLFSIS